MTVTFTKMEGLGNDYIYVNAAEHPLDDPAALSRLWSDRHCGIGADGLILIGESDVADFSMRIFNADGSEGMMCGNGARCVARYIHDKGLSGKTELTLETRSGIKSLRLNLDESGDVASVTVGMGQVKPLKATLPEGLPFEGRTIDAGNPHLVLLVDDAEKAPVAELGPVFETSFPGGINVEFVQVLSPSLIRMRVWERGSGITRACGTGACASAVAMALSGLVQPEGCTVRMDGGDLLVSWDPETMECRMTGPARSVFEGTIETD